MLKFETVIHIVTEGLDRLDAGEIAGLMIDASKIDAEFYMWCEPTRLTPEYRNRLASDNRNDVLADIGS